MGYFWQCRWLLCSVAVSGSVICYCALGTVSGGVIKATNDTLPAIALWLIDLLR